MKCRRRIWLGSLVVLCAFSQILTVVIFYRRNRYEVHGDPEDGDEEIDGAVDARDLSSSVLPVNHEVTQLPTASIELHLLGSQRIASWLILLKHVNRAVYDNWGKPIPCHLHLDARADKRVIAAAKAFKWKHGPTRVDIRDKTQGVRAMWMSSLSRAAKGAGPNVLMVVLEDHIRLSRWYFQWLVSVLNTYARDMDSRDSNLMGISLSAIHSEEMLHDKPWTPTASTKVGNIFLAGVPASWGAAYFSDRWVEFASFVEVRTQSQFYKLDLERRLMEDSDEGGVATKPKKKGKSQALSPASITIPSSSSNSWLGSWKRFMADFMYGRGTLMLYPHLPAGSGRSLGFASSVCVKRRSTPKCVLDSDAERPTDSDFEADPRIGPLVEAAPNFKTDPRLALPPYPDQTVFSRFLVEVSKPAGAKQGAVFLATLTTAQNVDNGKAALAKVWSRPGWTGPNICLPDLYMSARQLRDSMGGSSGGKAQRFLTYEPQFGVNNQFQELTSAIHWAAALNRTLLLPPILAPRASEFDDKVPLAQWLWFDDVFEIPHTIDAQLFKKEDGHMVLVEEGSSAATSKHSEWLHQSAVARPIRVLQVGGYGQFDIPSTVLENVVWSPGQRLPAFDLVSHLKNGMSVKTLRDNLGGCGDEVLAIQGMFFGRLEGILYNDFARMLKLNRHARAVLDVLRGVLQQKLGSKDYVCTHVRFGDFKEMCGNVSSNQAYKSLFEQGFKCNPTMHDVQSYLNQTMLPALVISDAPAAVERGLAGSPVACATSALVRGAAGAAWPGLSAEQLEVVSIIMEQELCIAATHVRLNRFSTFSMRMADLRGSTNLSFW